MVPEQTTLVFVALRRRPNGTATNPNAIRCKRHAAASACSITRTLSCAPGNTPLQSTHTPYSLTHIPACQFSKPKGQMQKRRRITAPPFYINHLDDASLSLAQLRHNFFRDVEVGVDVLHVIIIFQRIHQLHDGASFFFVHFHQVLRLPNGLH